MARKVIQIGKVVKVIDEVGSAAVVVHNVQEAVGRAKWMELFLRITSAVNAPQVDVTVNAVRPEAADTVPVAADDKVALAATLQQVGNGISRQVYGEGATDPVLPDRIEISANHTIATSTGDVEVWMVLHD